MLYTWNWHKTVNQLYFNNKNKDFKKYLACSKFPINGSYYGIDDPNLLLLLLLSHLSRVWLCATPWTAAYQAPPSLGLSRQEYWSGLPLPSPRSQFESIWYYCIILSHDRYRFSRWALGFWQRRTRVLRASEKCLFPQKEGPAGLTHGDQASVSWAVVQEAETLSSSPLWLAHTPGILEGSRDSALAPGLGDPLPHRFPPVSSCRMKVT